ncbi:MAG: DegT/DnrJ/EryC1/StrS family aminotransferase [Mogibacterium sp.]|nr:DegT/DnrJ/EryC1/StrS family aminotransferase [Mogibacterium sp.]
MSDIRLNEPANGKALRDFIARRTKTEPEDWFLTFRAREAMQVVFEEIRSRNGDGSIIAQPFTCSTVPESILAAGMKPLYCDISDHDLSLDPAALKAAIAGDTRAVILQHTYGIWDDNRVREIRDIVRGTTSAKSGASGNGSGILLVEDCAHCAGRMARDEAGKPLCDISVHSFGVEKMLRTSFGAAVWIDPDMADTVLGDRIRAHLAGLPAADRRVSRSVPQYITRIRILNHLPAKIRRPLRDHWTARRRFIPAVSSAELAGDILLEPSVPGDEVIRRVLAALDGINSNEARRQTAVACYLNEFSDQPEMIPAAVSTIRPLLWFPLITGSQETAERAVQALADAGYYSSTWGRPLLFPGVTDPERYSLEQAVRDCPAASRIAKGILLLPTGQETDAAQQISAIVKTVLDGSSHGSVQPSANAAEMNKADFIPILLGTETNVYNMARSFYEAYGITSVAYGRIPLPQSSNSKFVNVICNKDFGDPENFVRILNEEAPKYYGTKAVLISCGDNYTRILASVKDRLDPVYTPVCPDYESVDAVNSKVRLYQYCEQSGIPYPGTILIKDTRLPELPFDFPVVLKPDDADDYYAHPFEGQKKAFILQDREDLIAAVNSTYGAGYSGTMIIQEFIPGSDDNMRVVNGYKRSDGTVALLSMGHPLLEDYYPMAIGNYNVILTGGDDRVYDTVEKLLESIPYLGYFNLDLKYDSRDGIFKVFDFNPRMGRSSYYVTLAGHNLARCVVDDVVYHTPAQTVRSYNECLWADVPLPVIYRYIENREQRDHAIRLIRQGKCGGTFAKAHDRNVKRMLINAKADLRSIRNYHRYFVPKEK